MLTPPSEPACLDPDLPMNLDPSWGWRASSRARKSCTTHCFHTRFSVRNIIEPYHFLTQSRRVISLSVPSAPCRTKETFPGFSLSRHPITASPHQIRKQHQQKVVFPNFQNVKRTAFLREIKHDHQTTNIDLRHGSAK